MATVSPDDEFDENFRLSKLFSEAIGEHDKIKAEIRKLTDKIEQEMQHPECRVAAHKPNTWMLVHKYIVRRQFLKKIQPYYQKVERELSVLFYKEEEEKAKARSNMEEIDNNEEDESTEHDEDDESTGHDEDSRQNDGNGDNEQESTGGTEQEGIREEGEHIGGNESIEMEENIE